VQAVDARVVDLEQQRDATVAEAVDAPELPERAAPVERLPEDVADDRIEPAFVTGWLGRRLAKVDCVGLPNIASGEMFLPELIQDDCTPSRIAGATAEILADPALRSSLRAKGLSLRERLRGPGPTDAVVSMLGKEAAGAWA